MLKGIAKFNETLGNLKSQGTWPPHWPSGEEVEEDDLVLWWALVIFHSAARKGAGGGLGSYTGPRSPEDCLTGRGRLLLVPEAERRMQTDPLVRQWPEIVRGLPNPSNIAWGYSPLRNDYAGARLEPGGERGFMRKTAKPAKVRVIEFPKEWNDVLTFLGGGYP
jgi:hypothetical protein